MLDISSLGQIVEEALDAVRSQPKSGLMGWAIEPRGLAQSIAMARDVRSVGDQSAALGLRRGEPLGNGSFARRIGETAIVPVYGPLMARRNFHYWSYDEIADEVAMVAAMDDVRNIILDINSPGGLASGIEVADAAIKAARQSKRVISYIDGYGASAAYWLASAGEEVTSSVSSLVGSVGTVISYIELEGILTRMGARKVEVLAGISPNKRLDPLSDEGQAELKAITDDGGERFIDALIENRQINREQILSEYGKGLVFPAREASRRGMVDRILTLEELVAHLAEQPPNKINAGSATATEEELDKMSDPKKPGAATEPKSPEATITQADHDAAVAAATEAGVTKGKAEGAQAERERVSDLMSLMGKGHDDIVKAAIDDGKSTKADAALKMVEAGPAAPPAAETGKTPQSVLEKMDKAAEGVNSSTSATGEHAGAPAANTPDGWKAEWEASEKLQAEYPTAASYVATRNRDARKVA